MILPGLVLFSFVFIGVYSWFSFLFAISNRHLDNRRVNDGVLNMLTLTPAELSAYLAEGLDHPLSLHITRNRVSLIRLKQAPGGGTELRVNACLLEAPPEVLRALKRFLVSRRKTDWQAVCVFLQRAPRENRPVREASLRTAGAVYDLQILLDRVNAAWFPDPCPCRITWGKAGSKPRRYYRRHIAYGSYHRNPGVIRIHPLLDDPRVPEAFVAFIVYHERLHAALGAEEHGSRQWHHTARFRHLERQYPDFDRMQELAKSLVHTLDRRP
jgi:hypothetical protein